MSVEQAIAEGDNPVGALGTPRAAETFRRVGLLGNADPIDAGW